MPYVEVAYDEVSWSGCTNAGESPFSYIKSRPRLLPFGGVCRRHTGRCVEHTGPEKEVIGTEKRTVVHGPFCVP